MIEFFLNPHGIDGVFYEHMDRSYSPWGSKEMYDWCFRKGTDRIVGTFDGEIAYGAALYHRKVMTASGIRKACIIGDGWTLPEFRKRGLSTKGIEFGKSEARKNGISLMLSFVVKGRDSYRNMIDNEFVLFPARYYKTRNDGTSSYDLEVTGPPVKTIRDMEDRTYNRFDYDAKDWKVQFLDRVPPSEVLSISGGKGYALIENRKDQDSILSIVHDGTLELSKIISSLMKRAFSKGKELFHYSTDPSEWEILGEMGFDIIEGSVAVCDLDGNRPGGGWWIRNGDRM
jgi:hypothetical protein